MQFLENILDMFVYGRFCNFEFLSNFTVFASLAHQAKNLCFTISKWTLNGFYQPVGVQNTYSLLIPPMAGITWNSIKGGQTVPLKFNVFAGTIERTNVSAIQSFTVQEVSCVDVGTGTEDVEFVTTGATQLRYDGTPGSGGQFIQNWQTPKSSNNCYRTVMTTSDGSMLVAFFKTKK